MNTRQPIGSLFSFPRAFALGATLAALAYPAQAAVSPAQSPLFLTISAPPNITVTLDDSGSMSRAFTPDLCGNPNGICTYDPDPNLDHRYVKSSQYNPIYYDPTIAYKQPLDANGASLATLFTSAHINGFKTSSGAIDLSTNYRPSSGLFLNAGTSTHQFMRHYQGRRNVDGTMLGTNSGSNAPYFDIPNFFNHDGSASGHDPNTNLISVTVAGVPYIDNGTLSADTCDNAIDPGPLLYTTRIIGTTLRLCFKDTSTNYGEQVVVALKDVPKTLAEPSTATASVAAYYYLYDPNNGGNCTGTDADKKQNNSCYDFVTVSSTSGPGTVDINGDGVTNSSDRDERQNFANWYSFFRTRNLMTVTAASRAMATVPASYRVAWQSLNSCRGSTTSLVTNDCEGWEATNPNFSNAIKEFTGTHKSDFYTWLFRLRTNTSTPLREGMERVGEYYRTSGDGSPYDNNFATSNSGEYSCRKNYHVLMTDGIWNDSDISIGNVDNASATLPDGKSYAAAAPYKDSYSDTLADVAFKYWSTDLRTLTNNVLPGFVDNSGGAAPSNKTLPSTWTNAQYFNPKNDPATWQHMVNFTVGLGLGTFLSNSGLTWGGDTYSGSYSGLASGGTNWPPVGSDFDGNSGDLWHAAINSRGRSYNVERPSDLENAFSDVLTGIAGAVASASAVATNSTRLDTSAVVYQAKFNSSDWSGHLLAFDVSNTEDLNGNGLLDVGEDVNGNGVLDTGNGTIGAELWDAGASGKIPAAASRNVVTYNPLATGAPRGVNFLWANLTATPLVGQQALLNANTTMGGGVTLLNVGQKTLDYIRGDQAQEQGTGPFRKRTVILGDIVNSDPWFVGSEDFGYDSLPGTEGSSYVTFRNGSTYQQRRRMLYFGANDGMLHGIDAGSYSSGTFNIGTGAEKLAYVPDAVIPRLKDLTSPGYTHRYFVDGSPKAGDAYINSAWKTVLLGTTGAGGKAVFALDVTAPDSFGSSNVLWEISTTTSPTASDRTTDNASVAGFQSNLGYTLPQPSLVRMYDGSWAAIVANGYGSANNKAVLYIINAATGNLIRSIDTGVGSSTAGSENGLSTPIALDVDNDRITDYIYAGDLKGNLWKFNVTNSNPSLWDVAYKSGGTPKPLYVACTSTACTSANLQPITAKPEVGKAGTGQTGGLMVYFGTGKYFESADTTTTQTQTFYGIWDKCDKTSAAGCDGQVSGRASLQQQAITQELAQGGFNLRVTSNCTVNYGSTALSGAVSAPCTTTANRLGWYMDFIQPGGSNSNLPPGSDLGERIVSAPILRDGRIIFVTVIPSTDACTFGGTGWLMELGSTSGQRLASAPFDINGDGKIDSNDLVTSGGSSVPPSGKQSKVGIIETPGFISAGTLDYKYTSGSTGSLEVTVNSVDNFKGRKAWRQLR